MHGEHKAAWRNGKHQDQWLKTLEIYAFPMLGKRPVNEIEGPLAQLPPAQGGSESRYDVS